MHRTIQKLLVANVLVTLGSLGLMVLLNQANAASRFEVVATGLDNPRGLAFGPEGGLYVTEAGRGGEGPCTDGRRSEICYGATGAVTRIDDNGSQERVATGLPSLGDPNTDGVRATGPHDIAFKGRNAYVVIGLGEDPAVRDGLPEVGVNFGRVVQITPGGRVLYRNDIASFEVDENPDGAAIDSNPYGIVTLPGRRLVVDAGMNALMEVKANGNITTLAVFPSFPNPTRPLVGPPMIQAVPTSVAVSPDGTYYVGQLTGVPFLIGASHVFRVVPGVAPEIYLYGFTHIIDLEFDDAGNLYVLQIASKSLLEGDTESGALIRVKPDMSRETLLDEGLFMPGGIALAPDDKAIYISNCSVCVGIGEVLRLPLENGN